MLCLHIMQSPQFVFGMFANYGNPYCTNPKCPLVVVTGEMLSQSLLTSASCARLKLSLSYQNLHLPPRTIQHIEELSAHDRMDHVPF